MLNSITSLANHTKLTTLLISTQNDYLGFWSSCKVHQPTHEKSFRLTKKELILVMTHLTCSYKYITLSREAAFINTKCKNNHCYIRRMTQEKELVYNISPLLPPADTFWIKRQFTLMQKNIPINYLQFLLRSSNTLIQT